MEKQISAIPQTRQYALDKFRLTSTWEKKKFVPNLLLYLFQALPRKLWDDRFERLAETEREWNWPAGMSHETKFRPSNKFPFWFFSHL